MTSGPGYEYGYRYGTPPGGQWRAGADQGRMRACDADRERTADVLRAAFVEGRLNQDELDERLGQAYEARTYADLAAQTADLPVPRPLPTLSRFGALPVASSTNSMAVASFVCALLQPFFGLTTIPAVILGHSARRQIRHTGQRGDGLAIAGLVLGWIGLAIFVLLLLGFIASTAATGHPAGFTHSAPGHFAPSVAGHPNMGPAPATQP